MAGLYAIVDIETTGSYAAGCGITEIAIVIHDGKEVVNRYETLVNPGHSIPYFIQSLTGINDAMLADAPSFREIAPYVFELLAPCVFVAHSVNFDYSFVRHELSKAGFTLNTPRLCTVRMSRKVRPGLPSYSLGKLCDTLGITVANRHRAGGDADATAILFGRLLQWDAAGDIPKMLERGSKEQMLPPNVPRKDFDALPTCPGVYFFHDRQGKVVYVGKAKNIRKRVASHFTGNNTGARRQQFLQDICGISFERCGTELAALIVEVTEIKKRWPKYNRALKRYEPKYGLFLYEDRQDYCRLAVGKYNKSHVALHEFGSQEEGLRMLQGLCREFSLCPELCMMGDCAGHCQDPDGLQLPARDFHGPSASYNEKVVEALASMRSELPSFYILDKGRNREERCCIWVENGQLYGMTYLNEDEVFSDAASMRERIERYPSNRYVMDLIFQHVERFPFKMHRLQLADQEQEAAGLFYED
ncbi:exonuclease domain-containing protein [Rurimicrobium arvi]